MASATSKVPAHGRDKVTNLKPSLLVASIAAVDTQAEYGIHPADNQYRRGA